MHRPRKRHNQLCILKKKITHATLAGTLHAALIKNHPQIRTNETTITKVSKQGVTNGRCLPCYTPPVEIPIDIDPLFPHDRGVPPHHHSQKSTSHTAHRANDTIARLSQDRKIHEIRPPNQLSQPECFLGRL